MTIFMNGAILCRKYFYFLQYLYREPPGQPETPLSLDNPFRTANDDEFDSPAKRCKSSIHLTYLWDLACSRVSQCYQSIATVVQCADKCSLNYSALIGRPG